MSINDLNREEHRLRTFNENWPHAFIDINILAKTGFYYTGPHDQVKCHFCGLQAASWEMGDNEIYEHRRWSPNCPLLQQGNTANVPIVSTSTPNQLPRITECYVNGEHIHRRSTNTISTLSNINGNVNPNAEGIQILRRPQFPDLVFESARFETFKEWPKSLKQRPKELVEAGFFYTGKSDRVICFSCGSILLDWDENDIPWEQHALWFDHCNYVQLQRGQEYIDEIKGKFTKTNKELNHNQSTKSTSNSSNITSNNSSNASTSSTAEQKENKTLIEKYMCKICFANEYNTIFLPCGHVVCCNKCASSLTKCPLCQKYLERIKRIFFS